MESKTKRHKNYTEMVKVPTALVCNVCNCSPDLVRKYRNGKLTGEGMATLRVQIAEMLLSERLPALLQEVERLLPFKATGKAIIKPGQQIVDTLCSQISEFDSLINSQK